MEENRSVSSVKRGYLKEDFRFFHLKDRNNKEFDYHFHDFNKIIIFISGSASYIIEGKAYTLKPWDILFVSSSETHKPIIDPLQDYERIVIWVNPSFLEKHNNSGCNLLTCFELACREKFNILRLSGEVLKGITNLLTQLENANKDEDFGNHVLKNSLFLQLMVYFNRLFLACEKNVSIMDIEYDETIGGVMDYIKENLVEDLSVDAIATKFYVNKYYLMHKFKSQTGYTIHNYIVQKRLILANSLIKRGRSTLDACLASGFGDYSSFVRAFKNMFGLPPQKYYKILKEIEKSSI